MCVNAILISIAAYCSTKELNQNLPTVQAKLSSSHGENLVISVKIQVTEFPVIVAPSDLA